MSSRPAPVQRPKAEAELRYCIRVLRLLEPDEDGPLPLEEVPAPLADAFAAADREHDRVLRGVDPRFYYDHAVPSSRDLDAETARRLRSVLHLQEELPGLWGPGLVRYGDRTYRVWVQAWACG